MKKTLSLMLALALVFALVLVAAPAADAAACDHTDHTGWTALNPVDHFVALSTGNGLKAGKYYLAQDIEWGSQIRVEADEEVTICLNGHKLTSTVSNATSTFDAIGGSSGTTKLNICDCSAGKTGAIERTDISANGRQGAIIFVRAKVEVNVYGGSFNVAVDNAHAKASVGYITGDTGVINVYDDAKFAANNGVSIYANKGVLNVYGVAADMTAVAGTDGGQVYVNNALKADKNGETNNIAAFKAPAPAPAPNPSTGDSANLVVMGLGLVLGVAGMACLLPKKQTV